jgi:hypothetical protein
MRSTKEVQWFEAIPSTQDSRLINAALVASKSDNRGGSSCGGSVEVAQAQQGWQERDSEMKSKLKQVEGHTAQEQPSGLHMQVPRTADAWRGIWHAPCHMSRHLYPAVLPVHIKFY